MPYTPQLPDTIEDKMKLFEALCEDIADYLQEQRLSDAQRKLVLERQEIAEGKPDRTVPYDEALSRVKARLED